MPLQRHFLCTVVKLLAWLCGGRYALLAAGSAFAVPLLVFAQAAQQQAAKEAAGFVMTFNDVILFPTIALLTVVAFLVFLWGCAEYFFGATNEQVRQQGVKHITFGIIGLVIMVSAFAIVTIIANTFGLGDELDCAKDPLMPGCDTVFTVPNPTGGPPVNNTNPTPTGGPPVP